MQRSERLKTVGYFAATALTALGLLAGGLADLGRARAVVQAMAHLGYPGYFAGILGAWKLLGAVAIVAPRFPRLKEWAYAGIFFDLTGAALSHASVGDAAGKIATPLVLLAFAAASWALRPEQRRLALTTEQRGAPRTALAEPAHAAAH